MKKQQFLKTNHETFTRVIYSYERNNYFLK
jgi:hypothetical protein